MTIAFDQIPSNVLVPLFWLEVRPGGQPFAGGMRMLLIGARTTNQDNNAPVILSDNVASQKFGRPSMLAAMYRHARAISPEGEIWGASNTIDNGSSVASTALIGIADPAGKTGLMSMKIGENLITIKVTTADDDATCTAKLRKQINGNALCPFSAQADTNPARLNLTCKWHGDSGNKILITTSWYGKDSDLGNLITILAAPHNGAGGSSINEVLDGLNDDEFDIIVSGYSGDAVLHNLSDFLTDRWAPNKQIYGHAITACIDTFADLITKGDGFNDPHLTIIGAPGALSPEWCWAAEFAAHMQAHFSAPPEVSRPLHGLELTGVDPAFKEAQWFDSDERQSLYEHGISSVRVDNTRRVLIDGTYTTYKTNVWGDLDASWRSLNTMFQTMFFVRYLRTTMTNAYPRAALSDEPTGIPGFCSPGEAFDTIVHAYSDLQDLGLVENIDLFTRALVVERDKLNLNRLNFYARPDLVNQLDILAGLVQTELALTDDDFPPAAT